MSADDQPMMLRRVNAAQATLERFKDKPFRLGVNDCARMVATHLRKLGYKVKLPPAGSYRSWRSARKALDARGFKDLGAALDALGLERIAPAAALVGDIMEMPAEDELGALSVVLSNGRVLGYHQETPGAVVMQPQQMVSAWRVAA